MNQLNDLEHQLTGTMTARLEALRRVDGVVSAPIGPRMPSWWRGDEDASQSAVLAMQQLSH